MHHKHIPAYRVSDDGSFEEIPCWVQWNDEVAWVCVDRAAVLPLEQRRSASRKLQEDDVFAIVAGSRSAANAFDPRSISRQGVDVLASTGSRESFSVVDTSSHGNILICRKSSGREHGTLQVDDLQYNRFLLRVTADDVRLKAVEPVVVERKIKFYTIDHSQISPAIEIWARFGKACDIDCRGNYVRRDMFLRNPDLHALPKNMAAVFSWNGGMNVDTSLPHGVEVIAQSTDPSRSNPWKPETYPEYLVVSADDLKGSVTVEDFTGHRILLAPRAGEDDIRLMGSVKKIGKSSGRVAVRLTVFDPKTGIEGRQVASIANGPRPLLYFRNGRRDRFVPRGRGTVPVGEMGIQGIQLSKESERMFDLRDVDSSPLIKLLGMSQDRKSIFFKGIGWLCVDLDDGDSLMIERQEGRALTQVTRLDTV